MSKPVREVSPAVPGAPEVKPKGKGGRPRGSLNDKRKSDFNRTLVDSATRFRLPDVVIADWKAVRASMTPMERFKSSVELAALIVKASPRDLRVQPLQPRLLITSNLDPTHQLQGRVERPAIEEAAGEADEETVQFSDYRFVGTGESSNGEET